MLPLFGPLLSVSAEGRYTVLETTPEQHKAATLQAIVAQMAGLSRHDPVLMIFEDAHWADPTSLELLELIIERVQTLRVMVAITFRPEFTSPWSSYSHLTALRLNRFARSLVAAMIDKVSAGKKLSAEVLEQIIEKTDGVPLFVEELTKTIHESGIQTGAAIPDHFARLVDGAPGPPGRSKRGSRKLPLPLDGNSISICWRWYRR